MKLASNLIVAAALVLASAPAFAHGSGMGGMGGTGGMGHGNGMTVTTQNHDGKITVNDKTTKTFTFHRLELVRIRREIQRLDREILRLIRLGKGNSVLAKMLEMQRNRLVLQNVS